MRTDGLFIDGKRPGSAESRDVRSPFTGKIVATCPQASAAQLETALSAAAAAAKTFQRLSRHARSRLLSLMAEGIASRREEIAAVIVSEAGKPWTLADAEVGRAISTFTIASEEAKRLGGEYVPVDIEAGGRAYEPAVSHWVPRGPILAIAPFNFPLNLVAHKVAPALAVGAPVLLKPPPQAPGASQILSEIFEQAAARASDARETVPLAALQVVNASNDVIAAAVTDPRISILSFTGSDKVGWLLQGKAVRKKVILELGGNAAVIVAKDADLARAAARCAFGGFAYAGQICISVQRVLVQKDVAKRFTDLFIAETKKLGIGDPASKTTLVGPMIDAGQAERILNWIEEAKGEGAKVVLGGGRNGPTIEPTILTNVKPTAKLSCEEAFGPIVVVDEFDSFDEAIASVNRSRFGLQAGIFTDSTAFVRAATNDLDVGGILVNEVPTYRADNMPYGGVKDSGLGREGVRYTMEEYCERRTVIHWRG